MDLQTIKIKADATEVDAATKKVEDLDTGIDKITRTLEKQEAKMKVLRGETISLKDGIVQLGEGFTSAQANAIANLKVLDATTQQVKQLAQSFREQNEIMGSNPFDKSVGGIAKLQAEISELSNVNRLMAQGLNLSRDEIVMLARDSAALTQIMQKQGAETLEISASIKNLTTQYTYLARQRDALVAQAKESERLQREEIEKTMALERKRQAAAASYAAEMAAQSDRMVEQFREVERNRTQINNEMMRNWAKSFTAPSEEIQKMSAYYKQLEKDADAAMRVTKGTEMPMDVAVKQFRKDQAKETRDAAAANKYLEDAERRLQAALSATNGELSERYTDRLVKYEQALKRSGLSADVASAKMANFRKNIDAVAGKERAEQLRYLSRAMSVQMGDVGISLASGMNPLLVMIQQGDQIRGVIQQVGAEGKDLAKAMNNAAGMIARGFVDTGKAIGGFFLGTIKSAGSSITDTAMNLLGFNTILDVTKRRLAANGEEGFRYIGMLSRMGAVFKTFVGIFAFSAIAAIGAFGIALKQVIAEENALAKQLALTGGNLGLNTAAAVSYASALNSMGISTSKGVKVLTEMAKTSNLTIGEFQKVAKAAVDMETYAGVAIEDTVKAFSKMKDEPVKAMIELAKATGLVPPAVVKAVIELERQGDVAGATALAIKTLADTNATQVERMKQDYNSFSLFIINLGKGIKDFYDNAFKSLFYKASPTQQIENEIKKIDAALNTFGIGEGYRKELIQRKEALQEQLRLAKMAADAEQLRNVMQSQAAKVIEEAAAVRRESLSDEQKYYEKINSLVAKYKQAVAVGDVESAKIFSDAMVKAGNEYADKLEKAANKRTKLTDVQKEALSVEKLMGDLLDNNSGFTSDYTEKSKLLEKAQQSGKYTLEELNKAWAALLMKQPIVKDGLKEQEELFKKQAKAMEEARKAAAAYGKELDDVQLKNHEIEVRTEASQIKLNDEIEGYMFEQSVGGLPDSQRAVAIEQYRIQKDLQKEILALQQSGADQAIIDKEIAKVTAIAEQNKAWVAQKAIIEENQRQADMLADVFTNAFDDLISGGKSFSEVLKGLERGIMDVITQVLVLEPLKASLKGMMGGMGGIDGIFGDIGSFFGGFFADGGRPPLNKVSVVGESGPELFVPDTAGTVVPNHAIMNTGVQQQTVQIVQNFTIQGHSADRSTQAQVAAAALQGANRALVRNT